MEDEEWDDPKVIRTFRNVTGKKRLKSRYNHPTSHQKDRD